MGAWSRNFSASSNNSDLFLDQEANFVFPETKDIGGSVTVMEQTDNTTTTALCFEAIDFAVVSAWLIHWLMLAASSSLMRSSLKPFLFHSKKALWHCGCFGWLPWRATQVLNELEGVTQTQQLHQLLLCAIKQRQTHLKRMCYWMKEIKQHFSLLIWGWWWPGCEKKCATWMGLEEKRQRFRIYQNKKGCYSCRIHKNSVL